MSDLEEARQRRMQELQERQKMEEEKEYVLRKIMTEEAKARLTNVKLANPALAAKAEQFCAYLYQQQGQKITEEQLKGLLQKFIGTKKETKIIRK